MSPVHTTPAPAAASAAGGAAAPARRSSLPRLLAGGTLAATVLATAAFALWPASETDKARADGERFGEAVAALEAADTSAEVSAALDDLSAAASDTRTHAGDAVAAQAKDQAYALDRAVNGFAGTVTADDTFESALYQSELDTALDDLDSQAQEFRTTGPEVQQAFWDSYEAGYSGD